ncbi:MAG: hypothetical protein HKN59_03310 [Gammaproteobacteria bacterium]|nr:hypothetical protein [Gammaproteobacteria bacterium]
MTKNWLLIACLLMSAGNTLAESLDFNLNNDAARLTFSWDARDNKLTFDAGWLHHQDRGDVAHVGLHLVDFAASGPAAPEVGIGGKLFYVDGDTGPVSASGGALGLGGFFRYNFPQADRFGIRGQLYFAPDVVAFGDSKGYLEASLGLTYDVLRDADIYIGARYVKAEFENTPDMTIDSGLHIGLRLKF